MANHEVEIGVLGHSGLIGSSLMKYSPREAMPLNFLDIKSQTVETLIWSVGRLKNNANILEAKYEFENISNELVKLNFKKIFHFVLISSGGTIYGNHSIYPCNENSKENPLTPYGKLKLKIEKLLLHYQRLYGFKLSIVRLANVYSIRGSSVISKLISCVREQQTFDLKVHLQSRKQYGEVDNYASAIHALIRQVTSDYDTRIYNLFSPHVYTLGDIIVKISSRYGRSIDLQSTQSSLPLQSMILESIHQESLSAMNGTKWCSLDSFLETLSTES